MFTKYLEWNEELPCWPLCALPYLDECVWLSSLSGLQEYVNEMESVESSLKQMRENVCAVQGAAVPGLTSWGQDSLDQCQARWDVFSKQVRRGAGFLHFSQTLVYSLVHFYVRA